MRDDQRGGGGEHAAQRRLDERLRVDVERRQRVVEDEHVRRRGDGAREGEPLPLTAGEAEPLLADGRLDAVGQVVHEAGLRDVGASCSTRSASGPPAARSGRPSSTLSRTLEENSVASSKAMAIRLRSSSSPRSRMSTPSSSMLPPVTS